MQLVNRTAVLNITFLLAFFGAADVVFLIVILPLASMYRSL